MRKWFTHPDGCTYLYQAIFLHIFNPRVFFSGLRCATEPFRAAIHIHSGSCAPFSQGFRALVTDCAQALRPVSGISGFLKNALADFVLFKKRGASRPLWSD